ncbi:MAG: hypothetical protein KF689_10330 [Gemmatimonadaceae bacterium]|nr:hypothetical protein [Gemmatimonadaceae bacterium]MCW5826006.1 hypothetical protein [Gemmatimonadaceae bacterium]
MLEAPRPHGVDPALLRAWGGHVAWMCAAVGWIDTSLTVRTHAAGSSLAFTAPPAALLSATSLNEWALERAAAECGGAYDPASLEDERLPQEQTAALARLRELLAAERASPPPDGTPLPLRDIPIALVTGSNGKTTTTRLLAAMLRAHGHRVGFTCTDGVFIAGEAVERGDWSGPGGARRVLEDSRVTAAVLETARGGLLRRGLVVPRADVAVITNVAADHFGEYGIDSLADIAAAKGVVARALSTRGTLVLSAEDPTLVAHPPRTDAQLRWFGSGANTSGLLPPAQEMPIAMAGLAAYNIANAEAAACAARALGVPDPLITQTLRTFGRDNADNPGRLERFDHQGRRIWLDYAHNPHGLGALLALAAAARGSGRLGLILGQAGDRPDESLRALARAAWDVTPDCVVLQEMTHYLRGRAPGEVPAVLRDELLRRGARADQVVLTTSEAEAVDALLAWSAPGDLLVMPVHALEERDRLRARLQSV